MSTGWNIVADAAIQEEIARSDALRAQVERLTIERDAAQAELSRQATAYESTIADRERDRDRYQRLALLLPEAWQEAFMYGRESCGQAVTTSYVAGLCDAWLAEQEEK